MLEKIGGVRPIALIEDYDLSRGLERRGGDLLYRRPSPDDIVAKIREPSSGRDFLRMAEMHALYAMGVSPSRLARLYYRR